MRPAPLTAEQQTKVAALKDTGRGRVLVIVANGPSISQIPLQKLKNHPKIALLSINCPDARLHSTDYWAVNDVSQLDAHHTLMANYPGILLVGNGVRRQVDNAVMIQVLEGKGWSSDLVKGYFLGRSTTYASMQTAAWMDYDKVYIFGCEMDPDAETLWFYGPTNAGIQADRRRSKFAAEAEHFQFAADHLSDAERARFIFCSEGLNPHAFVRSFSQLPVHRAVGHIIQSLKGQS